ncbi:hypothetical protein WA158_001459 [Blastocystis sp. Blastoise]
MNSNQNNVNTPLVFPAVNPQPGYIAQPVPQYAQQPAPQYAQQPAPQYAPQQVPQYAQQPIPQYNPPTPGQPIYAQQPMMPINQFQISPDMEKALSLAKCIRIYAIIELVCYCITIIGLVFIYFPITAMRATKQSNAHDFACYRIWRIISLVLSVASFVYGCFSDGAAVGTSLVGVAVAIYVFLLCDKYYKLLCSIPDEQRNNMSEEMFERSSCSLW